MKPDEFRKLCKILRLSQAAQARMLCVSVHAIRKWRYGVYPIPPYVAVLLRLLVSGDIPREVWEKAAHEARQDRPVPVTLPDPTEEPIRWTI